MITVTLQDNNLILKSHYNYRYRIASIKGAYFDYGRKAWIIPKSRLAEFQDEFKGEIYYQTPLWKIKGREEPPKQEIKYFGDPIELPELNITPYSYQHIGARFSIDRIENIGFAMIGDAVGLGKTIEATEVLKWYRDNYGFDKMLVICKKSIKYQWVSEIKRFTGWEDVYCTGSTPKKRQQAYDAVKDGGILVTNYHNYLSDAEIIKDLGFKFCVIDEAHCIKGHETKTNKNISSVVKGMKTLFLTGTPVMSKPDDIWGIVNMSSPGYFGKYEEFENRYLVIEYGKFGRQIIGARHLDELQEKINKFLIRRTPEDVHLELPEKRDPIEIRCEMDDVQKKMYEYLYLRRSEIDANKEDIIKDKGFTEEGLTELATLNDKDKQFLAALQYVADDPLIFKNKKGPINTTLRAMVPKNYKKSSKTEATLDLVQEILNSGEKVIIFCKYATSARMLKDLIEKELEEDVVMYTGAENDETRNKNIELFRNDTNILIGTSACAEGLNLQFCRIVINHSQPNTFAEKEQRIGRVRRIGSKYGSVTVYDMVTDNSFDEVLIKKIQKDKNLADALL